MSQENPKRKFNDTLTTGFPAPKFGDGAIISATLREDEINMFKKVKAGDRVLIRKSKNLSAKGENYYFFEVLPPREAAPQPQPTPTDSEV